MVFVHEPPMAIDLFEPDGQAKVKLDLPFPLVVVDTFHGTVAEGDIVAGRDIKVEDLEGMSALYQGGKKIFPCFPIGVDTY